MGAPLRFRSKIQNITYTTAYTYNLAGEVDTMTYPSGRVAKQQCDKIGRLSTVKNNATGGTQYATSVAYNTASQVTGFSYANGVSASYGYSSDRLQLTSLHKKPANRFLVLELSAYSVRDFGMNAIRRD